jgi:hypothetical protein
MHFDEWLLTHIHQAMDSKATTSSSQSNVHLVPVQMRQHTVRFQTLLLSQDHRVSTDDFCRLGGHLAGSERSRC